MEFFFFCVFFKALICVGGDAELKRLQCWVKTEWTVLRRHYIQDTFNKHKRNKAGGWARNSILETDWRTIHLESHVTSFRLRADANIEYFFFSFFTSIHPRAGHKGVKHWARPSHIALTQVLHHIHTLSCLFFLTEKRGKATAKRASDINHYRCFPTEGISNSFGQWAGVCLDS